MLILLCLVLLRRRIKARAHASSRENGRPQQLALNPPGRWSYFLSHTQRSGRATTLASMLYADLDGVWLDVKMSDKSEAAMKEGVQNSVVVIAILTDDGSSGNAYFERPFCLSELRWAQEAGVFIQPVVAADDKQRIGELSPTRSCTAD